MNSSIPQNSIPQNALQEFALQNGASPHAHHGMISYNLTAETYSVAMNDYRDEFALTLNHEGWVIIDFYRGDSASKAISCWKALLQTLRFTDAYPDSSHHGVGGLAAFGADVPLGLAVALHPMDVRSCMQDFVESGYVLTSIAPRRELLASVKARLDPLLPKGWGDIDIDPMHNALLTMLPPRGTR